MHILGGILLLVVVFGSAFFVYTSGILNPVFGPLGDSLGFQTSTSTVSNSSIYYKQVLIDRVSLGSGLNQPMYLVLKGANSSKNPGIVLTGWSLKTNQGTYVIPKAANLYSGGTGNIPPEDIYFRSGNRLVFYSGKNPQGSEQAIRSALEEWRIWLGEDFLSPQHGAAILRDNKGKVVDEYKY